MNFFVPNSASSLLSNGTGLPNPMFTSSFQSSNENGSPSAPFPPNYEGLLRVQANVEGSAQGERDLFSTCRLSVFLQNLNKSRDESSETGHEKQEDSGENHLEKLRRMSGSRQSSSPLNSSSLDERSQISNSSNGRGPLAYQCHIGSFFSPSKDDYNNHMDSHFDHVKTEAHNLTPEQMEEKKQMVRGPKVRSQGKAKKLKCKHCDFVTVTKEEFWTHSKEHIKPGKMLQCPQCPFVTDLKHHLNYHLHNHYGSKPFKCPKCPYSCVNKSMLSSHMKSHLKIGQYRCANCSYVTKYCHSLKQHLRKYDHQPAMVLNPDGTPNPLSIIDVHSTRRGPKVKKDESGNVIMPQSPAEVLAKYQATMSRETSDSSNMSCNSPSPKPSESERLKRYKCPLCDFETTVAEIYTNHEILHNVNERHTDLSSGIDATEGPAEPKISKEDPIPQIPVLGYLAYLKWKQMASFFMAAAVMARARTGSETVTPADPLAIWYMENVLKRFQLPHQQDESETVLNQTQNELESSPKEEEESLKVKEPSPDISSALRSGNHICHLCDIAFTSAKMHTLHMGFHESQTRP